MAGSTRRQFLELAGAIGGSLALGCPRRVPLRWALRHDCFPQGVASGDPATITARGQGQTFARNR